ncbi:outer membrane beta-barrel protein [Pontibacter liquoris]|uniref:outer membrane beta-barrel protein n=1 Tax=Pontibacter liquoris TaxID=2905677 RepID=UPI001FA6D369|nr:outer membrane beta-barrel protein [Pontibacter liquoris]
MMKRLQIVLVGTLLLLAMHSATAQEMKIGAKVGVNFYNISDDPNITEDDTGIGTEFGIYGRIGNRLFVQPGVEFVTHKTFAVTTNQLRPGERDAFVAQYLRVPVLLGYRMEVDGDYVRSLRLMAGPSSAFLLHVKDNNIDLKRNDIHNAQFALSGGIGLDVWVLSLDLLYHHGLSTVLNAGNAEGKSRSFSVSLGVTI